jgi:hypothetical protein
MELYGKKYQNGRKNIVLFEDYAEKYEYLILKYLFARKLFFILNRLSQIDLKRFVFSIFIFVSDR